jgi:hypothetical protein
MPFDLNSLVYLRYEKSAFGWKRDRQTEKSETGENKLDLKYFEKIRGNILRLKSVT